jgi:surfeit locus 1 family protein
LKQSLLKTTPMLRLVIPTVAALAVALSALTLGNWQTRRGNEKEQLKAQIEAAKALPPIPANEVSLSTHDKRRVLLTGVLLEDKTIYIDNRTHKGQAGFHVVTPLKIDGSIVLILRGWIVRDVADRTKLPQRKTLVEPVSLGGLSQADLIKSYELGKAVKPGAEDKLWQSATIDEVAKWSGLSLSPFVVRQTEELKTTSGAVIADGLVRDWAAFNTDVDKHRGYAVQWYSLSGLSAVLWVWFVVVRRLVKKN